MAHVQNVKGHKMIQVFSLTSSLCGGISYIAHSVWNVETDLFSILNVQIIYCHHSIDKIACHCSIQRIELSTLGN